MKIAIVINTSWNIYNFRMGIVKALLAQGHQVVAIAPHDDSTQLLIDAGCKYVPVVMENKGANPLSDFKLILDFYKIYKSEKPNYILQYTIKPNIYGSIAAKLAGIPTINNVSGLGTVFLHDNLVSKIALGLYKFAFRFPKKVFFQNSDDKQLFIERKLINASKCDVLPGSGVNLSQYQAVEYTKKEPFTFLVIARLLFDKGIVEFVDAAKQIHQKYPSAQFQLLGFTDFDSNMGIPEVTLNQWIEEGIVTYLGHTKDVKPFIQNADCVVLPSYREGTPKALIEALALQKPIITTNVPGCKETVIDNENGYLCEVKSANDLAAKMLKMIENSEQTLASMASNGRKLAESKFDEKIVIQKYLDELK